MACIFMSEVPIGLISSWILNSVWILFNLNPLLRYRHFCTIMWSEFLLSEKFCHTDLPLWLGFVSLPSLHHCYHNPLRHHPMTLLWFLSWSMLRLQNDATLLGTPGKLHWCNNIQCDADEIITDLWHESNKGRANFQVFISKTIGLSVSNTGSENVIETLLFVGNVAGIEV